MNIPAANQPAGEAAETFALLVPCKNGAAFLPRLFASVAAQSRAFDEILLFDDASTDESGAVATQYGARVLRSDNSVGPAEARNRLVAASRCDWVHFHDADDALSPDYLAATATVSREPGVDFVICDMRWVDEATGAVDSVWHYDEAELRADPRPHLIRRTVGGINGLYRRDGFARFGAFDARRDYWEDLEFTDRWCRGGARLRVVPRELVTAFRRPDSYSNKRLIRVWRSKRELLDSWLPDCTANERLAIAEEAAHLAVRLLLLHDTAGARAALALNRRAGGCAPETRDPVLRVLRRVLPPVWTLRLQLARRRERGAAPAQ